MTLFIYVESWHRARVSLIPFRSRRACVSFRAGCPGISFRSLLTLNPLRAGISLIPFRSLRAHNASQI